LSLDFGQRTRPGAERIWAALAVAAVVLVAIAFAVQHRRVDHTAAAEAAYWDVQGPPCPSVSSAEFAARQAQAPRAFEFGGVSFARRFGQVSCSTRPDGPGRAHYPVCQFTSPDDLVISAKGQTRYFVPGVGQPATVSVRRGEFRCVMASHFRLGD
jgi:hypothetical protein